MATFAKYTSGDGKIPSCLIRDIRYVISASLIKIINMAIFSSSFPNRWKCARMLPVFKKGNAKDISNYRSISMLPNFAKVFEEILYTAININTRSFISPIQRGFVSGQLTATNHPCFTQYSS